MKSTTLRPSGLHRQQLRDCHLICPLGASRQRSAACLLQKGYTAHRVVHLGLQHGPSGARSLACHANLDDAELQELVTKMVKARPPSTDREKLKKAIRAIDEANSADPNKVNWEGQEYGYRQLYSMWLTDACQKLDPDAPDELFILARGKSIESWKLVDIRRDDYGPNSIGQRQWEEDRKSWLAKRLKGIMEAAGYTGTPLKLVEDVMMARRSIPDPRDIRKHDVAGPLGLTNYSLLETVLLVQTLQDAECLVFMDRTFPQMFNTMTADEVLSKVQKEFNKVSQRCLREILKMQWTPVQRKLLLRALPTPQAYGSVLRELEGTAAASTHPGDWRYRDFDYE